MNLSLLPYTPERDVYQLLQIEPSADTREIVEACRRLSRTFHPDFNRSPRATQEMQVVNAVRHLLTDPASRAAYDGSRRRFLDLRAATPSAAQPWPRGSGQGAAPLRAAAARRRPRTVLDEIWKRLASRARAATAFLQATLAELAPSRPTSCLVCEAPVEPGYRFCAGCGASLGPPRRLRGR